MGCHYMQKITPKMIETYKSISVVNPKNKREFISYHEDEQNSDYWWRFDITDDSNGFLPIPASKIIAIINKDLEGKNWGINLLKHPEDYEGMYIAPQTHKGFKTIVRKNSISQLENSVRRMF